MVGRLRSLPLTFLGALILGLADSYFGLASAHMCRTPTSITDLHGSLPVILLFVVLLVLPQDRVRSPTFRARSDVAPSPSLAQGRRAPGIAVGGRGLRVGQVSAPARCAPVGRASRSAIVMLSLVLLTGYGGQVSLAQLAFAGLGALTHRSCRANGLAVGLLVAALAAAVGALVALPALRLTGLYLALATWPSRWSWSSVFAGIDGFAFDSPRSFGLASRCQRRPGALRLHAAMFVGAGLRRAAATARRSSGAGCQAMKDSPAGCATLGLEPHRDQAQSCSRCRRRSPARRRTCWRAGGQRRRRTTSASHRRCSPAAGAAARRRGWHHRRVRRGPRRVLLVALPQVCRRPTRRSTTCMILLPGLAGIGLARTPTARRRHRQPVGARSATARGRRAPPRTPLRVPAPRRARACSRKPWRQARTRRAARPRDRARRGAEDCGGAA